MNLHQTQSQIAKDRHRFRVLCCGRRWGKTTLAIEEMIGKAISANDRKVVYIAPTYQQARDIAWQQLKKRVKNAAKSINESRLEIELYTIKGGTSTIYLRGWESVETLRGQKFDLIVIDEVAMMRNFWLNWQEVLRPTLTDTRGDALFISTPKGFNHFYDLYNIEATDKQFKSFHFTTYDNPYISHEEIEEAKKQLPEDRFAQEYLADFRKTEGLVYKEFDRERHLYDDKEIVAVETICGVDFGYTNPTAILYIKKDGDNNYWIVDEFYKSGQTTAQIIDIIRAYSPNVVYADPEAPDKIEELKRAGLNVREVTKGKGSLEAGIDKIRELLKQNRIKINKKCKNLINEFETYRYAEKRGEGNEPEKPIKENDHALDALRYVITMNANKPSFIPNYEYNYQPIEPDLYY